MPHTLVPCNVIRPSPYHLLTVNVIARYVYYEEWGHYRSNQNIFIVKKKSTYQRSLYMVVVYGLWCSTPLSTIFPYVSWRSVLLVEETGIPRENHRHVASH